jgi:PKD repeat protein
MRFLTITLSIVLMISLSTGVAVSQVLHPEKITKAVHFDVSKPLRSIEEVPYGVRKRNWKDKLVPNKLGLDDELKNQEPLVGPDPVLQDKIMYGGRNQGTVGANFGGMTNTYGVAPPDTDGDVGHDHYFQMVNQGFAIWDKSGNLLYGPVDNITLWDGFTGPWSSTNDGDPIILYDEYADRWIATQFSLPQDPYFYELIAVSVTSDPLGEWYRYAFQFDNMPDYPKFGVWPDGYYFSTHQFGGGGFTAGMSICDRDAMINGDPNAEMVYFNIGPDHYGLLAADVDGDMLPPEDSPNYIIDVGNNKLKLWEIDVDWDNTSNSTVTRLSDIPTEPFSAQNINISQPQTGQDLDALSGMTMVRLQYRNFGDYEVMLTNHTVNAGGGRAGVRWYELRNYGSGWDIYQQSTYAPNDGDSRWMGSISMNQNGDIAVGYSVSSTNTYPSIRVAGQSAGAPLGLGIFDIDETSIFEGTKSQTGISRWGDYSSMRVDPADGNTFWFTTEYSNGGWGWKTQIASFSFVAIPVTNFTSDEILIPVGETINYTDLSSGIPSDWTWTLEGATPATSNDQNPQDVLYETEGVYNVKLVCSNYLGIDSLVKETYITVSSTVLPAVDFKSDVSIFCFGETVKFTDLTELSPIQWLWEFEPSDVEFVNGTDETSQNPEVKFNLRANYSVKLTSWNLNGFSDLTKTDMIKSGGYTPYFIDTFEDNGMDGFDWTVDNPDNDVTWEIFEIGGTTPGNHAPGVNFRDYFAIAQRDRLISPPFNLAGLSNATLEFQHSYAQHTQVIDNTDSLIVYISDNCGDSWTRIWAGGEDGTGNFATHEPTDYDFFPVEPSDWCMEGWGAGCVMLNISQWTGSGDVKIAFETYSYFGNPIIIDNVAVTQTVGQDELASGNEKFRIYPNPSNGSFTISVPKGLSYNNLTINNHMGQILINQTIEDQRRKIIISESVNWNPGVYFVILEGSSGSDVQKLIIK